MRIVGEALEHIDTLTAPPVIGKRYLVPTVRGRWRDKIRNWPVMGGLHEDRRFFNFPHLHYHLDGRFFPTNVLGSLLQQILNNPLTGVFNYGPDFPLGPVVWRNSVCRYNTELPREFSESGPVTALTKSLANTQCRRKESGWICPHRGFALGSVPVHDGIITCPLHGLRIVAETGVVAGEGRK
jgi:hypothetical protein